MLPSAFDAAATLTLETLPRVLPPVQGESDRVVLLINFWHPDLAAHEKRIDLDTFGYKPI